VDRRRLSHELGSWCDLKATPCTVGPDGSTYDYDYDGDGDPTTGAPMPNWMYCTPPKVSSAITCSAGDYPQEIGWSLSCTDGTTLSHSPGEFLPYIMDELAVALGATCTLEMTDEEADGWETAEWTGFEQIFTMTDGGTATKTFVVQRQYVPKL